MFSRGSPAATTDPGARQATWRTSSPNNRARTLLAGVVSLGGVYIIGTTLWDSGDALPGTTLDALPLGLLRAIHLFVLLVGFACLFAGRELYFGHRRGWPGVVLLLATITVLLVVARDSLVRGLIQLGILGALLWRAGDFRARSDRATVAGALRTFVLGLLALQAYALIGFVALGSRFSPRPSFFGAAQEVAARLIVRSTERFAATTLGTTWFLDSLSILWIALVLAATLLAIRAARYAPPDEQRERDTALALLEQHGGQSIAYMTSWPGNTYFFGRDGEAYLAYRVIGDVALALGDPVGAIAAAERATGEFLEHCRVNGWTPCLYATTARHLAAYRALGLAELPIAEDAVIDLPNLAFKGKSWQDVRSAFNKAEREGVSFEWVDLASGPPALVDQIAAISAQWTADKDLPEMGFTLGTMAEAYDPRVRTAVAVDARRTVQGFTTWLPVYEAGAVTGWTIDLMRRRETPPAVRGTMEFLIARAALAFQAEGAKTISLSSAPLAHVADDSSELHGLQRVLDLLAERLEPIYGFRSLLSFKQKFKPRWEPIYLIYPGVLSLPPISYAILRAYLPKLGPGEVRKLIAEAAHALPHPSRTGVAAETGPRDGAPAPHGDDERP